MFVIISVLVSLLAPGVDARISADLNCTRYNGTDFVYTDTAVACHNFLSDRYCETAYPADFGQGYPREGQDAERSFLCYTLGRETSSPVNNDAKAAAIANCPRTCGFCCQTSAYKCQNALFPRINCSKVSKSQCLSVVWRQILAEDCPNVCGFCDLNGCIDAVVDCDSDLSICNAIGMQEFVNQNCRRTCNRCSTATPKPCNGR